MKTKNKSFLEDIFIISIVGILIYSIYSFFFSSDEKVEITETKTSIEKKIDAIIHKEPVVNEIKKEEEIVTPPKVEEPNTAVIETPKEVLAPVENVVEKKETPLVEEKIEQKEVEEKIAPVEVNDQKAKVELFYKTIREQIYANIHKNVDKNQIRTGEAVEIRLTILKDGGYEQLSSTKGDNEYFELFRSSIKEAFPVKIDNSLKESFPRYFRMKIEF